MLTFKIDGIVCVPSFTGRAFWKRRKRGGEE